MGLRNLSVDNMAEITGRWISDYRGLFLSIPEIAGLLPHVETAHTKILALTHHPSQNTNFSALISAERDLDRRHDHIYRAFYYLGKAWSEYVLSQEKIDEDLLERVQKTIGTLLPKGLSSVQNPFAQEISDASLAQAAMGKGPDIKNALSELRLTDNVAAVDMLESWFSLAEELGALERKKEQLSSDCTTSKPLSFGVCRNEWIKIVTSVLTALDYSEAEPEKIRCLRDPVDVAIQSSTMRYIEGRRGKRSVA